MTRHICRFIFLFAENAKTKFWRLVTRNPEIDRVIRVKSLMPGWDKVHGAVSWPTLLIDRGTTRETITPIWTKARYNIFGGMIGRWPRRVK